LFKAYGKMTSGNYLDMPCNNCSNIEGASEVLPPSIEPIHFTSPYDQVSYEEILSLLAIYRPTFIPIGLVANSERTLN
jgi:hypothetical protein